MPVRDTRFLIACWLSCCGTGALAEEASTLSSQRLEEVVVTANRQEENLREVPQSVTALTTERLEREGLSFFDDYVAKVPGMHFIQTAPQYSQLILRGISTGFAQPNASVATYVDDSPYGYSSPTGAGAVMSPNLDTFDMQRIEVLRGPQGTLYGANALGGLLKYVSSRPDPRGFSGKLETSVNSVTAGGTGWDVHGMLNAPLGETTAVRVIGYTIDGAGFIDNSLTGAKDTNDYTNTGGRVLLATDITEKLSARFTALYQRLKTNDQQSMDVDPVTFEPIVADLSHARLIGQRDSNENVLLNGTLEWTLDGATLVSSTSYAETSTDLVFDLSATYAPLLGMFLGTPYGAANLGNIDNSKFTQEFRLAAAERGAWRWQGGAFFTSEDLRLHTVLAPIDPSTRQIIEDFPLTLSDSLETGTYREYAAFADVGYQFTPAFDVSVGGRLSRIETKYHQLASGILTVPADFDGSADEDVVTYSGQARWRFSGDSMVYARVARGYQPGGPNRVTPIANLESSYDAATTLNYEIGVRSGAFDNRLQFELTAFLVDWSDIQLAAVVGGFYSYTNGGKARSKGVEWNLDYAPIEGLILNLNGAYTQAQLEDDAPASLNAFAGDELPYVPKWSASVSADYQWQLNAAWRASVGTSWRYTGARFSDFTSRVELPSNDVVDLRAGIESDKWVIQAAVKNVGDERAINSVLPVSFLNPTGPLEAIISRPRLYSITISRAF